MLVPATNVEWTVDMLDALEDNGQRYELIDGEPSDNSNVARVYNEQRLVNAYRSCGMRGCDRSAALLFAASPASDA